MRAVVNRLIRFLKLAAVIGAVVGVVRALRGGRDREVTGSASWPPLAEPSPPAPRTGPVQFAETATETAAPEGWVPPVDGACPSTHPIKGNAQSGIYHVPGGGSYARTIPERCYSTEEAAQADGFRRAKR